MKVEVVDKFEDFLALEEEWNNLLEKSQNDIVFLRHEWFRCWWEAFGSKNQLFIISVRQDNELIGIAPLMIIQDYYRGIKVRKGCFLQNENSPRCDFILVKNREEVISAILNYLKNNKALWDVIQLQNIPSESATSNLLEQKLKEHQFCWGMKNGKSAPYIKINSDWQTFFLNKSAKFKKVMRNKINRVKRLGEFAVKKVNDIEKDAETLTCICNISKNSWKGNCQGEITRNEENLKFFERLSLIGSQREWLNIWLLNINGGQSIAYEYHLKYKNRTYALRADFDEDYRDYTPGSVLEHKIIEHTFNNGINEYDFCGDTYAYKLNWANEIRNHTTLEIFNTDTKTKLFYFLEYKLLPWARKMGLNRIKNIFRKN